jgi:hypothetical protein
MRTKGNLLGLMIMTLGLGPALLEGCGSTDDNRASGAGASGGSSGAGGATAGKGGSGGKASGGSAGKASGGSTGNGGSAGSAGEASGGSAGEATGGSAGDGGSAGSGEAGSGNEAGASAGGVGGSTGGAGGSTGGSSGQGGQGGQAGAGDPGGASGQAGASDQGGAGGQGPIAHCGVPASCTGDLSNIGTDDFGISFTIQTTTTALSAVLAQRAVCMHGMMWDVRLSPSGVVGVEVDDGANYTLIGGGDVNDGAVHEIRVCRIAERLYLDVDGVTVQDAENSTIIGGLVALETGTGPCVGFDGTVALVGTVANVCVGAM